MKWIEVKVITTPEASEAVTGIMYDMGVGGLYVEDPRDILENERQPSDWDYLEDALKNIDPNQVTIRAYLSAIATDEMDVHYHEKIALLQEKLKNIRKYFDIGKGEIQVSEVFEKDWANNWKKYYKPVKVGEKVVIKPTWEEYQPRTEGEIIVEMDPGMAFGTGTHETTKMCVQLLEKYVNIDMDILDIGCGSGILGITALKLGAKSCLGVDIDENAVKVSRENAEINQVQGKMVIKRGDLLDVISGKFDIIVANIIADAIISLSKIVSSYLKNDGIFIASGIIQDRYEEVKNSLLEHEFIIEKELFMGEWVAVAVKNL
ncbi:MAG: ribosomal protein methyltransferase [Clostridiales bacterium]|nr:ribosomal protein methyltransferase [Clostridiales bacterium]